MLTHGSLKAASWAHTLDAFTKVRQPPDEAAQKVLNALTRFCSEELDELEPPKCFGCGYDYVLAPGSERSALCTTCAHEAVDTLANELTVFQELWRNLRVQVDQYPEHAELKAQLERVTRERDEALKWSNFHDQQAQRIMRQRDEAERERNTLRAELDAFGEREQSTPSRRPPAVHRGEGYRVIVELDEPTREKRGDEC
jgi:hypothetical protein